MARATTKNTVAKARKLRRVMSLPDVLRSVDQAIDAIVAACREVG